MSGKELIRNFVIISHVDHGKSTLADRFLELTHTVEARKMHAQYLDRMPLEREKGITIKMQPVRMAYKLETPNPKIQAQTHFQSSSSGNELKRADSEYILNLIDTPGHVDFSYEVSRSLAAVEGAVLLVDATQGVQAQTLSNLHLARREGLVLIPAVNKIDAAHARINAVRSEIASFLSWEESEISLISAKEGNGVPELLKRVIQDVPSPKGNKDAAFRALVFDSLYDPFKGIIAFIRVVDGFLRKGEKILLLASGARGEALEVGFFSPDLTVKEDLTVGEIGYIATGLKLAAAVRVGDTLVRDEKRSEKEGTPKSMIPQALTGYEEPKPAVFVSFFTEDSDNFEELADALEKLHLNDAALHYTLESSEAFGRGFRCGFLGMLHIEITQERLKREYHLSLIASSPSVRYEMEMKNGEKKVIHSQQELPDMSMVNSIKEPWISLDVITPASYIGNILALIASGRGEHRETVYLATDHILVKAEMPLAEIIIDFYDRLKSASSGYASMNYELLAYRPADLVRLDILVAGEPVSAFARIIPRDNAYSEGRRIVDRLKKVLPRQQFSVALQAAIGGKIIARETISALRKDVTGYLYGGDVTRKKKLLEKQKRGKKKLRTIGKVRIPPHVFLDVLRK